MLTRAVFVPVWLLALLVFLALPSLSMGGTQLVNSNMVLVGHLNSCAASGSVNAYACALDEPIIAYLPQTCYTFLANAANTASATINFGPGVKTIKKFGTLDLVAGDIKGNQQVQVCYDGVADTMQMQSQPGNPLPGLASGTSGGLPFFATATMLGTSALLPANALLLGGGAGTAPSAVGTLGTTTTVLHGNAAGPPTFGAVSLLTDVSGILPGANGGTGNAFFQVTGPAATLKTFTFPNQSAGVLTDVALVTATQGGTNNAFFQVTGPATSTKTFTFPNASATVLTDNAAVTVAQGGTGATALTGLLLGNGTSPVSGVTTSAGIRGAVTDETGIGGALVFGDSPVIITPTIASFVNATHTHTAAAGGGQLTDAALSSAVTVPKGGTGATTLTGLVRGNGASAMTALTSSTVGQVLRVTAPDTFVFGAVDLTSGAAVTGILPSGNLPATLVYTGAAQTYSAGFKQTFAPSATTAGLNVGSVAGNPSSPVNGDFWYNSATPALMARINNANVALGAGGAGTPAGSSGTAQYNNAGAFGGAAGLTFVADGTTVATLEFRRTARNATATLGATDGPVVECTAAADVTLTLPPTTGTQRAFRIIKVDAGVGVCIVQPTTGQSLNGTTNGTLRLTQQWEAVDVSVTTAGTTNWYGISSVTNMKRSIYIPAGSMDVTGACTLGASAVLLTNGPKLPAITCTDANADAIEFDFVMPDGWDGGVLFVELAAFYTGTTHNAHIFDMNFSGQCVSHGDVVAAYAITAGNTAESTSNVEVQLTASGTANRELHGTTSVGATPTGVVLAGTCAAGDHVYMHGLVDATSTTFTPMTELKLLGVKVEYTRAAHD